MPHITENLILETCVATLATTDQVSLDGALPGYRTFASKCANNDTVHYLIRAVDVVGRPTGAWETGRGTIIVTGGVYTLRRDTVTGSSNADALVAFAAGTKYVSLANPAPNSDLIRFDLQSALGLDFVGLVGMFPINTLRPGWLKANGAAVSRATYARLFAYYGTTWGGGDGSTTFNLPDYRGYFPRFFDDGRGVDSGRVITAVQTGQNLAHNHGITDAGHAHGVADPGHAHSAWTDAQGDHYHYRGNMVFNEFGVGYGFGSGGGNLGIGGINTNSTGAHGHNVGIAGAGTGISIYAAGTGITINNSGGAENRPSNMALCAFVKY